MKNQVLGVITDLSENPKVQSWPQHHHHQKCYHIITRPYNTSSSGKGRSAPTRGPLLPSCGERKRKTCKYQGNIWTPWQVPDHVLCVHVVYIFYYAYVFVLYILVLWISLGTSLPLMGVQQASEGTTPQPAHQPSPAVNDVSDNLRAKLYVLCNRIGRRDLRTLQ